MFIRFRQIIKTLYISVITIKYTTIKLNTILDTITRTINGAMFVRNYGERFKPQVATSVY